ncbi:SPASM domain-containing protein [Candidatus Daviesbacteria bacterium]|nr:SPASM domain-containing protein [Candidatus Daviesbacteria bacterium]
MSTFKEVYQCIPALIRYQATKICNLTLGVRSPDMFTTIDVGFDDWCNRRCTYCPVFSNPDRHGPNGDILPQASWERLLEGLQAIKFSGSLKPVHFNEPLLRAETVLFPRLEQARKALPDCRLMLYTNGDLLLQHLDRVTDLQLAVVLGIHDPVNPKVLEFIESGEAQRRIACLEIKDMRVNKLYNRASNIPLERIWFPQRCPNYSWSQSTLVINPKGDVVTCIQDHSAEEVWGNIGQENIMDIWNQREFWEFRERRRLNNTEGMFSICHACLGK